MKNIISLFLLYLILTNVIPLYSMTLKDQQALVNSVVYNTDQKLHTYKASSYRQQRHLFKNLFSEHAHDELLLVKGKISTPQLHLLNKMALHTSTLFGYEALKELLLDPLSPKRHELLKNRQAFIRYLVDNPTQLKKIKTMLQNINLNAESVLSLWSSSSINTNNLYSGLASLIGVNKYENGIEAVREVSAAIVLGAVGLSFVNGYSLLPEGLWSKLNNFDISTIKKQFVSSIKSIKDHVVSDTKGKSSISIAVLTSFMLFFKPHTVLKKAENNNLQAQKLLCNLKSMLKKLQSIRTFVDESKIGTNNFKYLTVLDRLGSQQTNNSSNNDSKNDVIDSKLITLLQKKTFNKSHNYFHKLGRVQVALKMAQNNRQHLLPLFKVIGEMDAFVAVAELVSQQNNQQTQTNKYCFSEFSAADLPILQVEQLWNPLLDGNKVITDNIVLGEGDKHKNNLLLTGPHGGGKSTVMKALAYSVILSQVFGIAPAKKCKLTIFSHISTYIDIHEDIEEGMSTFMVESERAHSIKNRLRHLSGNRFGFTLIDEPFKGTMQQESSRLITKFGKKIGVIPEGITIMSTHVEKPVHELKDLFVVKHLETNEYYTGRFTRGFKLKDGICSWWFNNGDKRARYNHWLQKSV